MAIHPIRSNNTPCTPAIMPVGPIFWAIAFTMMLLSVMSYLDRQILALLVPDLHRELGLSDLQVGTLIGPAFIFTYLLTLIAAGFIVDRYNKVTIIFAGTFVWAAMTFASAFAHSYAELIVLRGGLAIGEALLGPAATALIGELFAGDARRRTTATSIFLMGSTIGASGSAAFGAFALQIVGGLHVTLPTVGVASDWRLCLIAVSLPSFMLALVLVILGRKRRSAKAIDTEAAQGEPLRLHFRRRGASYALLFLAVNVMVMMQVGAFIWGPSVLMRRFGLSRVDAGYMLGAVALVSGVIGTLCSTPVLRRWAPDGSIAQFKRLVLALGPLSLGLLALAFLMPSLALCMILLFPGLFLIGILVTLPMQYLQAAAPDHLKGRIAVGMYVVLYLCTSGLGPIVPPAIASLLPAGPNQLGQALAFGAVGSVLIALLLLCLLTDQSQRPARNEGTAIGA